jgi:hypothetical protein
MGISIYFEGIERNISFFVDQLREEGESEFKDLKQIKDLFLSVICNATSISDIELAIDALCVWEGIGKFSEDYINNLCVSTQKVDKTNVTSLKNEAWRQLYLKLQRSYHNKTKELYCNIKINYYRLNKGMERDYDDFTKYDNMIGVYSPNDDLLNYFNFANIPDGEKEFDKRIQELREKILESNEGLVGYLAERLRELVEYVDFKELLFYIDFEKLKTFNIKVESDFQFLFFEVDKFTMMSHQDYEKWQIANKFKQYYCKLQRAYSDIKKSYYYDKTELTKVFIDELPEVRDSYGRIKANVSKLSQHMILLISYLNFRAILRNNGIQLESETNNIFAKYYTEILKHISEKRDTNWKYEMKDYKSKMRDIEIVIKFLFENHYDLNIKQFNFDYKKKEIKKFLSYPSGSRNNLQRYYFSLLTKDEGEEYHITEEKEYEIREYINECIIGEIKIKNTLLEEFELMVIENDKYMKVID